MTQSYSEYKQKARDHARGKAAKNSQRLYSLLHTPRLGPYQRIESDQDWIIERKQSLEIVCSLPWRLIRVVKS